jgi:parallel beta-helix repeat protein
MTLSSTNSKQTYAGDGTTTAFPIPFLFLDNAHIQAVLRDAAGNEALWTENTQYTLTGAGEQDGGTLTVSTAPVDYAPGAGETLVIRRVVPTTQETDYPEGGAFPAMAHEAALDKLTMLAQQNDEQVGRALRFRVSDPPSLSGEIPGSAARANRFLAFDADGAPIAALGQVGGVPVSPFMATLLDDVTAAVARGTLGISLTGVDLHIRDFGAVGDGIAEDTAAFTAAIAALAAGQRLRVACGTYLVTGIVFDKSGTLAFERGATLKLAASQPSGARLLTIAADDVHVTGGTFDGNRAAQGAATGQDCIFHSGRTNVHVDVDRIAGAVDFGFRAIDATDCSLRAGIVTDTGLSGIEWEYAAGDLTRCVVRDSFVDRAGAPASASGGINFTRTGAATGKIVGCSVVNSRVRMPEASLAGLFGIQFWGAGTGSKVVGCDVTGSGDAITIANGQAQAAVIGNRVYNAFGFGIEIADSAHCTVAGNIVEGNGSTVRGISIDGTNIAAAGNAVTGNVVRDCTDAAIYIFKGSYGCAGTAVTGNTIDMAAANSHGIYDNSCDDILIAANNLDGGGTALVGITIDTASRVTVAENSIANFAAQSVQVLAQNALVDNVVISGGIWWSGTSFQFLPFGTGSFGAGCKILGVGGTLWFPAHHVDFLTVAPDASYFVMAGIGTGAPEGVFAWGPSSSYLQTDGAPGAQHWVKESGTGNTGWRRVGNGLTVEVTVGFSNLASGAAKALVSGVAGARFKLRGLTLSGAGTNFNAGGDRNLSIQDASGAVVWSVIPAATLKALNFARWGDVGLPAPATPASLTAESTAGDAIVARYVGGTTDYVGGSLTLILEYERTT